MAIVYTLSNQKGGSSKTTTASMIAAGSTQRGKKTLAIDMDMQANLTFVMNGDPAQPGIFSLITGDRTPVIQHTEQGDLLAGSTALASFDSILHGEKRIYALRDALKALRRDYDIIVIDTPPTLGTPLINALVAADSVIIPIRAMMIHLQGLYSLSQTIEQVKEEYNHRLKVAGVLFTEYNGRSIAAQTVTNQIRETAAKFKYKVFDTVIREGCAINEAQIMRESIFSYAPRSKQAIDYNNFLNELGV